MAEKNKIIRFKPICGKKLKKIWRQYNIRLNFNEEWDNFLNICDNNVSERLFAINNFLLTEFLIIYCGLKLELLEKIDCCCDKNKGELNIPLGIYYKNKHQIDKFFKKFKLAGKI